jgi:hypothetical protein
MGKSDRTKAGGKDSGTVQTGTDHAARRSNGGRNALVRSARYPLPRTNQFAATASTKMILVCSSLREWRISQTNALLIFGLSPDALELN